MEDKNLVQRISLLKGIKPKEDWVLFAKTQILADSEQIAADEKEGVGQTLLRQGFGGQVGHILSFLRHLEQPVFVLPTLVFLVVGGVLFQVSQSSLPGDPLYSLRSTVERTTMSLGGQDALASLELAQKRLEDLKRVVEENRVKNLSSATEEFQKSVAEVSKGILDLVEKEPGKALQASKELVQLQKDKALIEQVLGAAIGEKETSELQDATKILLEAELNDLVGRTLNKEQKEIVQEAIIAYQAGDYGKALEKVWEVSNR